MLTLTLSPVLRTVLTPELSYVSSDSLLSCGLVFYTFVIHQLKL